MKIITETFNKYKYGGRKHKMIIEIIKKALGIVLIAIPFMFLLGLFALIAGLKNTLIAIGFLIVFIGTPILGICLLYS